MIMQLVKQLDLRRHINQLAPVFKLYAPYDETDHMLNIAFNLLAGGTCLDHLELRRNDEAYLDALGVSRIPDPTTASGTDSSTDRMVPHSAISSVSSIFTVTVHR